MYTLTLIFNKDMDKVLMCNHRKLGKPNFVGGHIEYLENPMDASYREVFEETGISKEDIELKFLQTDSWVMCNSEMWNLYVTYGILNKDVELVEEANPLYWEENWQNLIDGYGEGILLVYLNRALKFINN